MAPERRPWIDELHRKHECGPSLSPFTSMEVEVGGRATTLHLPQRFDDLSQLQLKAVIGDGPLIAVLATHPGDADILIPTSILMVARRSDDDSYVVHVWHDLYHPWALQHLGLLDAGEDGP